VVGSPEIKIAALARVLEFLYFNILVFSSLPLLSHMFTCSWNFFVTAQDSGTSLNMQQAPGSTY